MIEQDYLQSVVDVIETHLIGFSSSEANWYKYGSYFKPKKYRRGTSYLELYIFILSHVLDIINAGLDYEDYGFTDSDIYTVIDKSNELIFYYV